MSKVCLVLEGGGNRGIYTSGVLDAFLENKIYINDIYGVSAGALNALSYISRQKGRSLRINKEFMLNKDSVDAKRILFNKDVLNLDLLINDINFGSDPLDLEAFNKYNSKYIVTCTNVNTGTPFYKQISDYEKEKDYIKASASLPLFTNVCKVDGLELLDGGISDSIPVFKALEDGYDKVIVILTRDKDFKCEPYDLMKLYKIKYSKYPNLLLTMNNRHNKYNTTRDLIEQYSLEGKVVALYPSEKLDISNLDKSIEKIEKVYDLGYQDGLKFCEIIKEIVKGKR